MSTCGTVESEDRGWQAQMFRPADVRLLPPGGTTNPVGDERETEGGGGMLLCTKIIQMESVKGYLHPSTEMDSFIRKEYKQYSLKKNSILLENF